MTGYNLVLSDFSCCDYPPSLIKQGFKARITAYNDEIRRINSLFESMSPNVSTLTPESIDLLSLLFRKEAKFEMIA